MKTSIIAFALVIGAPVVVWAAPGKEPASPAAPAGKTQPIALQVCVTVPPSMRPWREDDLAEAFADRVATALHDQGFVGRIAYVSSFDQPVADRPLLTVNLIEWRMNHVGMVDCTYSARLSASQGQDDLGIFSGTGLMMFSRRDWFGRADQYEDAARDALNNLYKRIAATQLLVASPKVSA